MSETDDCKRPWDHAADYYSTSELDERLTHESLDECLVDHFENENTPGLVSEVAAKGVTVYAWRRDAIDLVAEAKSSLDTFVLELAEEIADEYGDPNGGWRGGISTDDAKAFMAIAQPALVALLATVKPWRCHVSGDRTFTAAELLAWVREHNPKWLEGKT